MKKNNAEIPKCKSHLWETKKQKSPSLRKPNEYQNVIQVSHLPLDLNINSLLWIK